MITIVMTIALIYDYDNCLNCYDFCAHVHTSTRMSTHMSIHTDALEGAGAVAHRPGHVYLRRAYGTDCWPHHCL